MRLTSLEITSIKEVVFSIDPNAEIYLYGSRVDDAKRGGDIDLLIMSSVIDFDNKITISSKLFEAMGEQKVDVLISNDDSAPFTLIAKEKAVKL